VTVRVDRLGPIELREVATLPRSLPIEIGIYDPTGAGIFDPLRGQRSSFISKGRAREKAGRSATASGTQRARSGRVK